MTVATMATERVRMVLLVDEELREALRAEAALTGREMSEIVAELLREHLADTLEQVRQRRAKGGGEGKRKGGK